MSNLMVEALIVVLLILTPLALIGWSHRKDKKAKAEQEQQARIQLEKTLREEQLARFLRTEKIYAEMSSSAPYSRGSSDSAMKCG